MTATKINSGGADVSVKVPTQAAPKRTPTYLPLERYVISALEQLVEGNAQTTAEARTRVEAARRALKREQDPMRRAELEDVLADARNDVKFFLRATTAFRNALREWQAGVRPDRLPSGSYFLPSSSGGESHILVLDGVWRCCCPASAQLHWPSAMMLGIELAEKLAELDDRPAKSEPEPEPEPVQEWVWELAGVPMDAYNGDCENNDGVWVLV